jgi:hypothetical protein
MLMKSGEQNSKTKGVSDCLDFKLFREGFSKIVYFGSWR